MSILPVHNSSQQGWDALARTHPSALRIFLQRVLPFSLVPPLMLEYAGQHIGTSLFPDTTVQTWSIAALSFLFAELATVPLLAWAIKAVTESKMVQTDYHDAFHLVAIAAIPLWLSSLALFLEQPIVIAAILFWGVAGSVVMLVRGVGALLAVSEELVACEIAYIVTALGLIAWVVLVMLGLVPALS